MRKIGLVILAVFSFSILNAQVENTNCEVPTFFCTDTLFNYSNTTVTPCANRDRWYFFEAASGLNIGGLMIRSNDSLFGYSLYGPFASPLNNACGPYNGIITSTVNVNTNTPANGVFDTSLNTWVYTYNLGVGVNITQGYYYIRVKQKSCNSAIAITHQRGKFQCVLEPCDDCIGSFAPNTNKKYVISAWAKQDAALPSVTNYTAPKLKITAAGSSYSDTFSTSGAIIDGWQKIDGEFTLPSTATSINITLECQSGDCFFDDIRVFPFDGSMKSYVYDPVTMRLVAELDERNYATLYEYDEEGKLVRVKKETEKGIMTIKENRNNSSKQ